MTGQWPGLSADHGEPLVLSVGTGGGVTSGFKGFADGGGLVRLGESVLSLSDSEYLLWDAGLRAPTRPTLLQHAHEAGITEPQSLLRDLAEAGLVLDYMHEPLALKGHAHALTARLTGRLIGNGPHGSTQFLVEAGPTSPPLALDIVLYQFLLWADGRSPIALSCARLGTSGLPHEFDAIYHVAEWLPALLRAGLISLDRVSGGERVTLLCRARHQVR